MISDCRRLPLLIAIALFAAAGSAAGEELRLRAASFLPLGAPDVAPERLHIEALSLPGGSEIDLDLERFEVLAADFRFDLDGRQAPLPAFLKGTRFFHGRVAGQPDSQVVLLAWGDGTASGAVEAGGRRYELSVAGSALLAVEPFLDEPADLEGCEVMRGRASDKRVAAPAAARPVQLPVGLYGARVHVESDHEFFVQMGGTVEQSTRRLVDLFAQIAAIVEDEIAVRPQIGYLGIWSTPEDPWWDGPDGTLGWSAYVAAHPVSKYPRAFTLVITDRRKGGGYLPGVCRAYSSTPENDLALSWPNLLIAAHEVGHVLGSDHTHCYSPPVDRCSNREEGCYDGPQVPQPMHESSLMSYCGVTSRSFGAPGRYGDHSERVPEVMRRTVELADAEFPACLTALTDAVELRVESTGSGSATLAWNDIFTNETGWTLEQLVGKKWKVAKKLSASTTRIELRGLAAGRAYSYRVLARFKDNVSEPSVPVAVALP